MTAATEEVTTDGYLRAWDRERGFGFIETGSQPKRKYYAHISEFVHGDGQIKRGAKVEFVVGNSGRSSNRRPARVKQIRVVAE